MKTSVKDLVKMNLKAVQVNEMTMQIILDCVVIHESKFDTINIVMINQKPYMAELVNNTIEIYGVYTDFDDDSKLKMNDNKSHIINIDILIEQVLEEIVNVVYSGDLACLRELLTFVPIENLKGYLPHIY